MLTFKQYYLVEKTLPSDFILDLYYKDQSLHDEYFNWLYGDGYEHMVKNLEFITNKPVENIYQYNLTTFLSALCKSNQDLCKRIKDAHNKIRKTGDILPIQDQFDPITTTKLIGSIEFLRTDIGKPIFMSMNIAKSIAKKISQLGYFFCN